MIEVCQFLLSYSTAVLWLLLWQRADTEQQRTGCAQRGHKAALFGHAGQQGKKKPEYKRNKNRNTAGGLKKIIYYYFCTPVYQKIMKLKKMTGPILIILAGGYGVE